MRQQRWLEFLKDYDCTIEYHIFRIVDTRTRQRSECRDHSLSPSHMCIYGVEDEISMAHRILYLDDNVNVFYMLCNYDFVNLMLSAD